MACGSEITRLCPACGCANPPFSNFCKDCGKAFTLPCRPISNAIFQKEMLRQVRSYSPADTTEKVLAQLDPIPGERRQVTVVFCSMEGYPGPREKIDPEEAYALMDQVYGILIRKIHEYAGTVTELTGDGVVALFGAPIAVEDAGPRAIRSAFAIHRQMARFSEDVRTSQDLSPIRMRIGIHSGPVVVGSLGIDGRMDFKAVGDTVNQAARVEGLAEPGTIYVTEDTFKLTEGFFRFESLGQRKVKGRKQPIRIYQVIAASNLRTRFDVNAERGLTPYVGRAREYRQLLDSFAKAKAARGQAFSVIGEAGVGKSRFLYEFRKAVANENIIFFEGKCLSHGKGLAYRPIIDMLKSGFDIKDSDTDDEIRQKVKKHTDALAMEENSTVPFLLDLLSVKNSGLEGISMSPEARKDRTLQAIKQLVLQGAKFRTRVIAIEDLHWVDKSSETLLSDLLESIAEARVLLIFTYRPPYRPPWKTAENHYQTTLKRLSGGENHAMVSYLLGTLRVDQEVEELIHEKAEGVPFFIEELLRSLKEMGIFKKSGNRISFRKPVQQVCVPSTIQDVIMARVDSLPDVTKAVLQNGAAIEKEFEHELIQRVTGLKKDQLLAHLNILKDAGLIYEQGIYPASIYSFKHALIRDVVYGSILMKTKKKLHQKIGAQMEQLHHGRLDSHLATLIAHFQAARNLKKVAHYGRLACKRAENAMALHDARDYARQWIDALEELPPSEKVLEEIVEARTALGFILFRMSNMAEAKEAIDPIIEQVVAKDLKILHGQVCVILGSFKYMVEEDLPGSIQYLQQAIEMTGQTGDLITSSYAQYMLGLVLAFNCDFEKSIHYFENLLNLSLALEFFWSASAMKSNISVYGYDYHGRVDLGYQTSQEAVRIAEESGDIYSKAMAYASHGASCYYRGIMDEAERCLKRGIELTEKIDMAAHKAMAHQWLGHVCYDRQNYRQAQFHHQRAISVREQSRLFPSSANLNRVALMRARMLGGETHMPLEPMLDYVRQNRVKIYEGCLARYLAEILMHRQPCDLPAAEQWIQQAICADRRNAMDCDLGRDYALYGALLRKKGDLSKATALFKKAIETFCACGADGWMRRTEKDLMETECTLTEKED
jgi:class 3 adenylate cyclase/tetratricopeptide (TPR) repeat protein